VSLNQKHHSNEALLVISEAVWLSQLDVALGIAAVNMALLLTIFLMCHPTKLQNKKYYLQNVHLQHPGTVDTAYMLLESIFIREGSLQVDLPSIKDNVQFLISHISST